MLDPHDKVVFDGMVTRLRADDPAFQRRIVRLSRPRRRLRLALAILLWTIAPLCIVFGGWTGLLMAAVGAGYGAYLVTKRDTMSDDQTWPSSTHRHPGAAL